MPQCSQFPRRGLQMLFLPYFTMLSDWIVKPSCVFRRSCVAVSAAWHACEDYAGIYNDTEIMYLNSLISFANSLPSVVYLHWSSIYVSVLNVYAEYDLSNSDSLCRYLSS